MKKAAEDVITSEPDLTRWDTVSTIPKVKLSRIQLTLTRSSEMEIVERLALPVLKPLLKLLVMGSEKMGMLWICSGS